MQVFPQAFPPRQIRQQPGAAGAGVLVGAGIGSARSIDVSRDDSSRTSIDRPYVALTGASPAGAILYGSSGGGSGSARPRQPAPANNNTTAIIRIHIV